QNLLQHFNSTFWVLFDLSLRFHRANGRGRDLEETFLSRFAFRDLRATQQLAASEKFGLLLKNFLEQRNCVTEMAQLDGADRLEPKGAQRFAQFLFGLTRHRADYNFIAAPRHHKWSCVDPQGL